MKLKKGFTMVELIIVIAVLAILAVGAVIAFQGIQANARRSNLLTASNSLAAAIRGINNEAGSRETVAFITGVGAGAFTQGGGGAVDIDVDIQDTSISFTIAAGGGLGEVVTTVSFASQAERDNAMLLQLFAAGPVGSPPIISVDTGRIEAWDTRTNPIP